jgi:hypothetical protein
VALYLSLPKLDADTATLSDRLFVANYLMVSVMIAISILRVNRFITPSWWGKAILTTVHITLIPAMVVALGYYVWQLSTTN